MATQGGNMAIGGLLDRVFGRGSYGKDPADLVAADELIERPLVIFRSARAGLEQSATKN